MKHTYSITLLLLKDVCSEGFGPAPRIRSFRPFEMMNGMHWNAICVVLFLLFSIASSSHSGPLDRLFPLSRRGGSKEWNLFFADMAYSLQSIVGAVVATVWME